MSDFLVKPFTFHLKLILMQHRLNYNNDVGRLTYNSNLIAEDYQVVSRLVYYYKKCSLYNTP